MVRVDIHKMTLTSVCTYTCQFLVAHKVDWIFYKITMLDLQLYSMYVVLIKSKSQPIYCKEG